MYTRTIEFLVDVNGGVDSLGNLLLYRQGQVKELEFLQASQFIKHGWAEDYYSKQKVEPVMHVSVYPHDQVMVLGNNYAEHSNAVSTTGEQHRVVIACQSKNGFIC